MTTEIEINKLKAKIFIRILLKINELNKKEKDELDRKYNLETYDALTRHNLRNSSFDSLMSFYTYYLMNKNNDVNLDDDPFLKEMINNELSNINNYRSNSNDNFIMNNAHKIPTDEIYMKHLEYTTKLKKLKLLQEKLKKAIEEAIKKRNKTLTESKETKETTDTVKMDPEKLVKTHMVANEEKVDEEAMAAKKVATEEDRRKAEEEAMAAEKVAAEEDRRKAEEEARAKAEEEARKAEEEARAKAEEEARAKAEEEAKAKAEEEARAKAEEEARAKAEEEAMAAEARAKVDIIINSKNSDIIDFEKLKKYEKVKDMDKFIIDKYIEKLNNFFIKSTTINTTEENIDKLIEDLFRLKNKLEIDNKYTTKIEKEIIDIKINTDDMTTEKQQFLYKIKINIIDNLYPNLIEYDNSEILNKYLKYNISYFNMSSINNEIDKAITHYDTKIKEIYSKKTLEKLDDMNKYNKKFYTIEKYFLDIKYKIITQEEKSNNTIKEEFDKIKHIKEYLQNYINNYYKKTLPEFDEKVKKFVELKQNYNKTKEKIEDIKNKLDNIEDYIKKRGEKSDEEISEINKERNDIIKRNLNTEQSNEMLNSDIEEYIKKLEKDNEDLKNIPDIIFYNYKESSHGDKINDLMTKIMPINETQDTSQDESHSETLENLEGILLLVKTKIDEYIKKNQELDLNKLIEFNNKLKEKLKDTEELLEESKKHLEYYDIGLVSKFVKSKFVKSFFKGGSSELYDIITNVKENEIDKEIIKDIYLNTLTIKEIDIIQNLEQEGNDMTNKIKEFNDELKEFKNEMKKLFENNNK